MAVALSPAAPGATWSENRPREPKVEVIATGLEAPWALAFAPGGDMFVTERPGRIRVTHDGRLAAEPLATLNAAAVGEGGLMGLAIDPGFPVNRLLNVCCTAGSDGRLVNRLVRLTIVDETTGDAGKPGLAQRHDSLAGKILRLAADGAIPSDNPFPGSPVYALGLRNPQGLGWDGSGRLFATDLVTGPHDEINEIVPGGNSGWSAASSVARDPRYRDPMIESDGAIWKSSGIAIRSDTLYVAALLGHQLVRIRRGPNAAAPLPSQLAGMWGRLRDVVVGPDGALYMATSNRDGRGTLDPADDPILRVRP